MLRSIAAYDRERAEPRGGRMVSVSAEVNAKRFVVGRVLLQLALCDSCRFLDCRFDVAKVGASLQYPSGSTRFAAETESDDVSVKFVYGRDCLHGRNSL